MDRRARRGVTRKLGSGAVETSNQDRLKSHAWTKRAPAAAVGWVENLSGSEDRGI